MTNKKTLDPKDETIRGLALAIATGEGADKDPMKFYCRNLLLAGPLSMDEAAEAFKALENFNRRSMESTIKELVAMGALTMEKDQSNIHISDEMKTIVLEVNPGAWSEVIPTNKDKQEEEVKTNDTKSNPVTDKTEVVKDDVKVSGFQMELEKIHTGENIHLADDVIKGRRRDDSQAADLVALIYNEGGDTGLDFQTLNSRFDVSGERAALFVKLSTDLEKRGVIKKLNLADGETYAITAAFIHLLKEASDDNSRNKQARGNTDTERFEVGDAKVGKATSVLSPQGVSGEVTQDDYETLARSVPYVEVREHGEGRQRGNATGGTHGKLGNPQGDTNFTLDEEVMKIEITVLGKVMEPDLIRQVYQTAIDFLRFVDNNRTVESNFTAAGITFDANRAQQFVNHARFYGLAD